METWAITRLRERHTAVGVTDAKLERVERLSREWQRLVRHLVHALWSPQHLAETVPAKGAYAVQKRRRAAGEYATSPLNAHYQSTATARACAIVRASWEQTFSTVRRDAASFPEPERHEINWLLRWPVHLQAILSGGVVVPDVPGLAGNDHARLDRWLRRKLLARRPQQPRLRVRPTLELDASHYRVSIRPHSRFPVWLVISGLERGHPIRLPMAGAMPEYLDGTANLRCAIVRDAKGRRRVVVRVVERMAVEVREGVLAGADKGIASVLTLTTGDQRDAASYGPDYGPALTRASQGLVRRNRSRLHALARSAEATDARKAARIRRHNLGPCKRQRRERRAQAELRRLHNTAIRQALAEHPEVSTLAVEDLSFRRTQDRGPAVNRRLNRWAKGQLHADLLRLSEAHGVRLQVVNAAYSSQACPRCSWTARENRSGPVFRCRVCGLAGSADAVAASNLRSRASDPEITRFTPFAVVKQLLLRRYAERIAGGGPGEQVVMPVSVVPLSTAA